jgi:hypothetical protein
VVFVQPQPARLPVIAPFLGAPRGPPCRRRTQERPRGCDPSRPRTVQPQLCRAGCGGQICGITLTLSGHVTAGSDVHFCRIARWPEPSGPTGADCCGDHAGQVHGFRAGSTRPLAAEPTTSPHPSIVDMKRLRSGEDRQVRAMITGAPPGTRTPNPRIESLLAAGLSRSAKSSQGSRLWQGRGQTGLLP